MVVCKQKILQNAAAAITPI